MPRNKKDDPFNAPFPSALRKLFEERKEITHEHLAECLNVRRQTIGRYCDGSSSPSFESLCKIGDFFGVSTEYLLGRSEKRTPNFDVLSVCGVTGLSEEACQALIGYSESEKQVLNALFTSPYFREMIQEMYDGGKSPDIKSNAIKAVIKNALSADPDKDIQALRPILNKDFDGLYRNGAINAAYKLYDEVSETIWKEAEKHGKH